MNTAIFFFMVLIAPATSISADDVRPIGTWIACQDDRDVCGWCEGKGWYDSSIGMPGGNRRSRCEVCGGDGVLDASDRARIKGFSEKQTPSSDDLFESGSKKMTQSQFTEAIADFDKALLADPEHEKAYLKKGLCKICLGDFKGAKEDYSKLLEISPSSFESRAAYNNRGYTRFVQGDFETAMDDLEQIDASIPEVLVNCGITCDYLGEHDTADEYFEAAIEFYSKLKHKPMVSTLYCLWGESRMRKRNDSAKAIVDFDKALAAGQKYPKATYLRGMARRLNGDFNEAIKDLSKAIEQFPGYSLALKERGQAKEQTGDIKGSIEDYTKALASHTKFIQQENLPLGIDSTTTGGYVIFYKELLDHDKILSEIHLHRGGARYALNDYRGALEDYSRAVELNGALKASLNAKIEQAKSKAQQSK